MIKNSKSIACPSCKSNDIDLTIGYINADEREVVYEDTKAFEYSRDKVMDCKCKKCDTKYSVNQGREIYTLLRKPMPLTVSGDVELISFYTTEFGYDFKLLRMSTYNNHNILMAQVENDQYPVIIPDEKGIEKDSTKVKSLIFNTWMNRYR